MNASTPEQHDEVAIPEGPGQQLRRAREAANISIGEVSARLHLDIKTMRAIESDDYTQLPAPAFVRGYLRGYARMLNVPVEPLVASFDIHGLAPPPLVADISESPEARTSDFPVQIFTWLIVLALAALVFMWWRGQVFSSNPSSSVVTEPSPAGEVQLSGDLPRPSELATSGEATQNNRSESRITLENPTNSAATQPSPEAADNESTNQSDLTLTVTERPLGSAELASAQGASGGNLASQTSAVAATAQATANDVALGTATAQDVATTQADAVSTQLASSANATSEGAENQGERDASLNLTSSESEAPSTSSTAQESNGGDTAAQETDAQALVGAGSDDNLVLRLGNDSWVEVYDRNESKLYWNLARAGREINVTGPSPMRVLIGKTERVEVVFNGQEINFAPFMTRGVARFLLGPDGAAAVPPKPGEQSTSQ